MNRFFRSFIAFSLIATLAIGFLSCGNDDEPEPQPEVKTRTLLYAVMVYNNNLLCGTLTLNTTDADGKEVKLTLPGTGNSEWGNTEYAKAEAAVLNALGKDSDNGNGWYYDNYHLRYVKIPNVKVGATYKATASYAFDNEMINKNFKDGDEISIGNFMLFPVKITASGDAVMLDPNKTIFLSPFPKESILSNGDNIISSFIAPVTKTGTMTE